MTVVDRVKELIKNRGFQVAPAELESLLLTNEDIADAAVIGKDDEEQGEIPYAFVVRKNKSLTEKQVMEFTNKKVET